MDPVALGLGTALCWGIADFVARFVGRAVGALTALAAVTVAGAVELSLYYAVDGRALPGLAAASGWAWAAAAATMLALLMFYEALRRAPVVMVAPLVGSYPAWGLLISVTLLDVRPPPAAWAAMMAVMAGMVLVAGGGGDAVAAPKGSRRLALGSAVLFSIGVLLAQRAAVEHGALDTVWYTRVLGGGMLVLAMLALRRPLRMPLRWGGVAAAQATLDTGGYVFLYAAAIGLQGAVASVVSSAFGVVSVVLARIFLAERMRWPQLLGMALVFGGVALLSAQK